MSQEQASATFIDREFGHYRIAKLLGRGGMGEVYLAEDTRLRRKVALKFLPAALGDDSSRVRRFEQEALAASALNHPNIVTVYEFGADNGQQFLVTEFVEGRTLREVLHQPTFCLQDALRIAEQTALALSAAHKAGIVHRDVKPENIMLREDGIVKVLDFGLAKLTGPSPRTGANLPLSSGDSQLTRPHVTIPGSVLGTAVYMSPEQARGQDVDARTDVWSLGVVIYEMLAGLPPFVGETSSDVIAAILKSEVPPLVPRDGAIPFDLERLVRKALRKNRDERYPDISDLLIDLRDVLRQLDMQAHGEHTSSSQERVSSGLRTRGPRVSSSGAAEPVAAPARPTNVVWRHTRLILATMVAVTALLAGFAVFTPRHVRTGPDSTPLRPGKAPITLTPLAIGGDVAEATISPDGRLVGYVRREGIYQTAYVQSIATGASVAVVPPTETGWRSPTFSPDSSRLFLLHNESSTEINQLHEVPVGGGRIRRVITDVDSTISFAPGGDRFVFRRNYTDRRESSIILANLDGSGERTLATRQIAEGFENNPAWSPDGRTIASVAIDPSAGDEQQRCIVVIDPTDGTQKVLGRARWRWSTALAWFPDGRELLLNAKEHAIAPFQIWRVGFPRGDVLKATNDANTYRSVSVTADASALLTVQDSATGALFVASLGDPRNGRRLTPDTPVRFTAVGWTPDGRVLYGSNAGGHRSIWVMNADGSGPTRLSRDEFVNDNPVATPDGRYIIYQSEQRGYSNIWRMDADGSNPRQLTFGNSANNPSVTSDSRWVVYDAATVATAHLFKVSVEGGDPQELTTSTSHFPVVSPDGKSIAFSYYPGGSAPTTLSIVGIGGGIPRASFRVPSEVSRWQRDGRALIYVDNRPGQASFRRLPLETGIPTTISPFGSGQISAFDLSPDGKHVVFVRVTSESHVVKIGGFR